MNGNEACQTAVELTVDVFVGIDISKLKLDVARLRVGKVRNKVFSNDRTGFKALAAWLAEDCITAGQAHVCMEATGPYSEALAIGVRSFIIRFLSKTEVPHPIVRSCEKSGQVLKSNISPTAIPCGKTRKTTRTSTRQPMQKVGV